MLNKIKSKIKIKATLILCVQLEHPGSCLPGLAYLMHLDMGPGCQPDKSMEVNHKGLVHSVMSVPALIGGSGKLSGGIPLPTYSNKSLINLKLAFVIFLSISKSFISQVGFTISTWRVGGLFKKFEVITLQARGVELLNVMLG